MSKPKIAHHRAITVRTGAGARHRRLRCHRDRIIKIIPVCGMAYNFWIRTITMYPWYYKVPEGGFRFAGRVWKGSDVTYCDPSGIGCT